MSGPLSPQSLSTHNRIGNINGPSEQSKSPIAVFKKAKDSVNKDSFEGCGPPSSPFQTEVEQENRQPSSFRVPFKGLSPSRSHASPLRHYQDEVIDDFLIIYSTENTPARQNKPSSATEASTQLNTTPEIVLLEQNGRRSNDAECAPPQSAFEVDYSDVPRRQDNPVADEDNAPTVISEDTCFSTFSAIPNADMTLFANIGNFNPVLSPPRRHDRHLLIATPKPPFHEHNEPTASSPSPTPKRTLSNPRDGDTTNLLLDFTQQFEGFPRKTQHSPQRRGGPSPVRTRTEPNLLAHINNQRLPSPSKSQPMTPRVGKRNLINLLDFDLPPQPTPRSIPTITARELESLKSTYLSEISSLKASLNGREAEIESLKKAVNDAERRVGEALETIRDERNAREHAEKEKVEWEKKGKEVEKVLHSVKEEFELAEKEREDLLQKLEESNRAREEAEIRAIEVASRSGLTSTVTEEQSRMEGSPDVDALVDHRVALQLDEKMENLARELHAVYKKKHETKVATLKKTYEARGEKRYQELQQKVEELSRTQIGQEDGRGAVAECTEHKAELLKHQTHIERLMGQIDELRRTQGELVHDLEQERAEKGDLVAAVDEMLALQTEGQASSGTSSATPVNVEGFRKSIGVAKPSGLRAPGASGVDSRLGKTGGSGSSMDRGGSAKSRMMHNIERMGGARAD